MIERIKRLIMESLPYEPGKQTTYEVVYNDVGSYCIDLGIQIEERSFNKALHFLHTEQCLVYFSPMNIKPTQYGLNKYK